MRNFRIPCLALALILLCAGASRAHRATVFAYADGDALQVDCYFSKSQKVRHGRLLFSDLATGAALLEGVTDAQGSFRFRPDADFLSTGHGLNIQLKAGEGHHSERQISPEELAALSPAGQAAKPAPGESAPAAHGPQPAKNSRTSALSALEAAELESLIAKVLDAKLAPIRQSLARQEDGGPTLRDVIGGIGWIIGLLGLAAYMKYKA